MEIEFDPEKAAANPLNHEGVTFDEARPVFLILMLWREKTRIPRASSDL